MPGEFLDSKSEIASLYTRYLSRDWYQEIWFLKDAQENPAFAATSTSNVNSSDAEVISTADSRSITYSNFGEPLDVIDQIRVKNQEKSALLKLPTELLITIWKMAFGSFRTMRVHGMVYRRDPEDRPRTLSLAHTCSLLHTALYPVFLSEDAFVFQTSSRDSTVAASELTQWLEQMPSASALSGPIRILILMELEAGRLHMREARKLAAEVQLLFSASEIFWPAIVVETRAATGCYCGPDMNVLIWPPSDEVRFVESRLLRQHIHHDETKGWVATMGIVASGDIGGLGGDIDHRQEIRAHTEALHLEVE
jgi:hypothetical protein